MYRVGWALLGTMIIFGLVGAFGWMLALAVGNDPQIGMFTTLAGAYFGSTFWDLFHGRR